MNSRRRTFFIVSVYILLDVVLAALSLWLACIIRRGTLPFPVTFENLFLNPDNPFHLLSLFWVIMVVLFNHLHGLYQTRREIYEPLEVWEVFKSVFLSALVTIVVIYGVKLEGFPRTVMILTTALMVVNFSVWRIAKRCFVRYLVSHGYNNFNVLIVGAGKIGQALEEEISKKPDLGLRVVGFLDDFKGTDENGSGPRVIGRVADFVGIARREFINKIFITIHHDSAAFLKLLEEAQEIGVAVRVVPQGFELTSGEFTKYNIGFIPILEYGDNLKIRKQAGKRLFDFATSAVALIILSPVFILLGIFIKIDSRGPVFYYSRRYGRGGKIFNMYKFRSMISDADGFLGQLKDKNEVDGPIFKIRNDPRVTRMGKFLRKYSLDELPQLFNVLIGEMSLVGPRPLPIAQIEKEDLRQLKRLEIRPGITGLWQIRGRSDISFEKLVKWDIWYINNWSFWLDINILFQTVPVVLRGKGAY